MLVRKLLSVVNTLGGHECESNIEFVSFIETWTKSLVQKKTWRIPGDKFQTPTAKTLIPWAKKKQINIILCQKELPSIEVSFTEQWTPPIPNRGCRYQAGTSTTLHGLV